jgi:hypothetical protein
MSGLSDSDESHDEIELQELPDFIPPPPAEVLASGMDQSNVHQDVVDN